MELQKILFVFILACIIFTSANDSADDGVSPPFLWLLEIHPESSGNLQKLLRHIKTPPEVSGSIKIHPESFRSIWNPPETFKILQLDITLDVTLNFTLDFTFELQLDSSRFIQIHLESSRIIQIPQELSRIIHNCQKLSRIIRNPPESSQFLKNHPDSSRKDEKRGNILKTSCGCARQQLHKWP